jgi:hypothetical protein
VVHSKGFGLLFAKFGKEKEHGADVEVHEANESASDDLRGMSAHDVELLNARRALRRVRACYSAQLRTYISWYSRPDGRQYSIS